MPFERSLEIESRLDEILRLIRTGRFSTPMLAEEVGVSIPTISRCVTALRQRGYKIKAQRQAREWRYVLAGKSAGSPKPMAAHLGEPAMKTKKRGECANPDSAVLKDIVTRVVESAQPEKIVLFGSAARGTMGPNSDIDLLVIKGGKFNYWRVLTDIYRQLPGTAAVDVVLVTPEDVARYRHSHCLVICPALREGKVIYDSQAISAGRSA
jgi:predicted nucleotidyltransferase/biotin operon repressor